MTNTPRTRVIAGAWRELGDGVAPLSNAAGLPLARTVKLVLDPLVVRPAQRPHLGHALLEPDTASELRERILAAAGDLVATAEWFTVMKRRRRARGITSGSPQDLYFQRAYEQARTRGAPGPDAADEADRVLDEVHDPGRVTAADLRDYLTMPAVADRVRREIDDAWEGVMTGEGAPMGAERREATHAARAAAMIDACAAGDGLGEFDALVAAGDGSARGDELRRPGAARAAGMSDADAIRPPEVGSSASKASLPAPFDRSILERLFQAVSALDVGGSAGIASLVSDEARRSAEPWQLGDEAGRVVMSGALAAVDGDGAAARALDDRWRREPFVRRALRTPGAEDPRDGAREAFLRRLWARLQGRELRRSPVDATEVWDLIDGVTRSVILDRRDAAKARMGQAV